MLGSDFYFRDKIPVAVLGAMELAGQWLVQLLSAHPWFEIVALCDAEPRQSYGNNWLLPSSLPAAIAEMPIQSYETPVSCSLIFSGLQYSMIDLKFMQAGYYVFSCFAPYPQNESVSLLVAEVNSQHLELMKDHRGVIATPNFATIGLCLILKPLIDHFGLKIVHASIQGQQRERIEQESLKILGQVEEGKIKKASFKMHVQCCELKEMDELVEGNVSFELEKKVSLEEIIRVWSEFYSKDQRLQLPSAAFQTLDYSSSCYDKKGMTIYLKSLYSALDYQVEFSFNPMIRGLIRSTLLNAELLVVQGKIYW